MAPSLPIDATPRVEAPRIERQPRRSPGSHAGAESGASPDGLQGLLGKCEMALRHLSAHPWILFAVLWAANALTSPYAGYVHDARLYALQTLNTMSHGAYADDLFLRYGSQDQYTPYSRLMAPVAQILGLDWAFFTAYVLANALLLFAIQRFVRTLIDDRLVSTLALLFVALAPLPYGGLAVFRVLEPFFTPRIVSCALAIFSLEQTLRHRHVFALGLALAATIAHPLMGFGALMIWGLRVTIDLPLPLRALQAVVGVVVATGVTIVSVRGLGVALFGTMEPAWLEMVRSATPYNFPGEWTVRDWLNATLSLGVAFAAARLMRRPSPEYARFLLVVGLAGTLGLTATLVASQVPYLLLLQGQPYRVLWILKVLQPPLVLWLAMRAWPCGLPGRIAAIALVGFLGVSDFLAVELAFPLVAFPCFVAVQRGLKPTARRPDWLIRSLVGSLVVGLLAWELLKLAYFVAIAPELLTLMELTDYARMLLNSLGPLIWLGLVLAALTAVVVRFHVSRVVVLPAVAIGLIAHFGAFAVPRSAGYREVHDPDGRDLGFARTYLEERVSNVRPVPTLYAGAWGRVDYLWIHLGVKSYYEWAQVVGTLFSRENAREGRRRADLVSRFELDRFRPRERFLAEALKLSLVRLFRADLTAPPPTQDDLVRLCRDEALDVAVLKQDFGDLVAATNGHVFIYECVRVRMAATSEKGA